jgi:hypothetical protein
MTETGVTFEVHEGVVVKRAAGFGRDGFVAEATVKVGDGYATVREVGFTKEGAVARAVNAARHKMTARKRACGFTADGYRTRGAGATFAVGFA